MAPKNVVVIGSRLPFGLILSNPLDKNDKVEINGLNKSRIIGATHVTTEVPEEFWAAWKGVNGDSYQPFTSGAIFEAADATEAAEVAKDLKDEKTGLEPLNPESNGVKPADKE